MIHASGLTKYYGDQPAVSELDFHIAPGEVVGLLGRNGAGKTTVLKILSCLLLPSSGRVTVGGHDVVDHSMEVRRLVGFLPDRPPLYDEMRVRDYLRFAAGLHGLSGADAGLRVDEAMRTLNLWDVRTQVIATLSHGYRQRVGIAQAIASRPKVVILDEPISGLDPMQIVDMRNTIHQLRSNHTVLISSHNLHEISETCDRILVIDRGRIVAQGTETDLAQRYVGGYTARVEVRGVRAQLDQALGACPAVTAHNLAERDGVYRGTLTMDSDARGAVSRALVEAGLELREITRAEDELESVFLTLTNQAPENGSGA